jgi:hypothetical protein
VFSAYDFVEAEITTKEIELCFEHEVTAVLILSKVDCYVKFNDRTAKEVFIPANFPLVWPVICRKIYVRAVSEKGKFYAWGEVV